MYVSVIIPSFNRAHCVARAIDSVLMQNQSFFDSDRSIELQVIVVDDGSSDDTESLIAERYPEITYLKQENRGVSSARNKAIKHANGEWIALLDSDDEWLPNKLQQQLHSLQQSKLKVCHTEELWIRNGVQVNQMKKHQKVGGAIFQRCLPLCAMSPSSIVLHQSVFEQVGLFDESLPACEDYDLWLRVAALYEVDYIETPLIRKYGGHEDQLSRQYWGMDRFRVIALQKLLRNPVYLNVLSDGDIKAAHRMLMKKLNILLKGAEKHSNTALIGECETAISQWSDSALDQGVKSC